MRILIIGGKSLLAQSLSPLLSEFATVITAGRKDCDITIDLTAPPHEMRFPENIDIVINTAAAYSANSADEMINLFETNVAGLWKICNACVNHNVGHLIHISSIFSYLEESSPFYSGYSLSKQQGEHLIKLFFKKFNLPYSIIQPSQFYGSAESLKKHHPFVAGIIEKAAKNEDITFYGSNDAQRNFIHIDDVAKCIVLICKNRLQGVYPNMYPQHVRYSEIANAAITAFSSSSKIIFLKEYPDIENNVRDIDTTLYDMIDYHPEVSMLDGIKRIASNWNTPI